MGPSFNGYKWPFATPIQDGGRIVIRSEMILNYWLMERHPNLKEEFGGLNPGYEISSLLDIIFARCSTASCALVLASQPSISKTIKIKPLLPIGDRTDIPQKRGTNLQTTLKQSSSKLGTCQGQNSLTFPCQTPFRNQPFQMCVASQCLFF